MLEFFFVSFHFILPIGILSKKEGRKEDWKSDHWRLTLATRRRVSARRRRTTYYVWHDALCFGHNHVMMKPKRTVTLHKLFFPLDHTTSAPRTVCDAWTHRFCEEEGQNTNSILDKTLLSCRLWSQMNWMVRFFHSFRFRQFRYIHIPVTLLVKVISLLSQHAHRVYMDLIEGIWFGVYSPRSQQECRVAQAGVPYGTWLLLPVTSLCPCRWI